MDYKDYTLKAVLQDVAEVKKRLATMEAKFVGLDRQKDHHFETARGKLKLRQGTIENLIAHYERVLEKGAERTIVYRYDKDPSQKAIDQLLANHRKIAVVLKDREIFTIGNIKIHLDTLANHQRFIEVEAMDHTNAYTEAQLKNQCLAMVSALGIPPKDLEKTGYLPKDL